MVLLCRSPLSQKWARHQFSRARHQKRNHNALTNERKGVKKSLGAGRKGMWSMHSFIHSSRAGTISSMLVPDLHLQRHIDLSLTLCLLQWKPTSSTFNSYFHRIRHELAACLIYEVWTFEFAQTMMSSIHAKELSCTWIWYFTGWMVSPGMTTYLEDATFCFLCHVSH